MTVKNCFLCSSDSHLGDRSLVKHLTGIYEIYRQDVSVSNEVHVDVANTSPVDLTKFQGSKYHTSSSLEVNHGMI